MLTTHEQNSKNKLVATVLAIVVIAGVIIFVDHLKSATSIANTLTRKSAAPVSTISTTPANTSTPSSTSSNSYRDGTYTASSYYYVPHGNESIQVSLTLKDGVITAASVQNSEGDPDSASYQEDFTSEYKTAVIGQKVSGLKLNIIAGASDTTQGFNDAVAQIASKAQA